MASFKLFLLLSAAFLASARLVHPLTDPLLDTVTGFLDLPVRYKEVPSWVCELDPRVKSYSGYVDVSENEHIFFWFFEARDVAPDDAPLTVWINGGPGSSSMISLFEENGPCVVGIDREAHTNPYSWSKVSNMLYIDQPTLTGFSYSGPAYTEPEKWAGLCEGLRSALCPGSNRKSEDISEDISKDLGNSSVPANSTHYAAPNFYKTLQGFMGAFPQYARADINLATMGFGGHYGPIFSEYIWEQNAELEPRATPIRVKSLSIGHGWFDPSIQYDAYYRYLTGGNTYRHYSWKLQKKMAKFLYGQLDLDRDPGCLARLKKCADDGKDATCSEADLYCCENVELFYAWKYEGNEFDIREPRTTSFPHTGYVDFLNDQRVQAGIGALRPFEKQAQVVADAFASTGEEAREYGIVAALRTLVERGVTVTLYAGDAAYLCNWLGIETVSEKVGAPGFGNAGYANLTTIDSIIHGQVKQAGNFSFVRVYDAGYQVPFWQPLASLAIFERTINGKDIATGHDQPSDGYVTQGAPYSLHRQGPSSVRWKSKVTLGDKRFDPITGRPKNQPGLVPPPDNSKLVSTDPDWNPDSDLDDWPSDMEPRMA